MVGYRGTHTVKTLTKALVVKSNPPSHPCSLSPTVEASDSKPDECEFESHREYMETVYDDVSKTATLSSGQTIYSVHKSTQCYGKVCPLHNPSDHPLRDYPLWYDAMIGSFFREINGQKVVDPDDYRLNSCGQVIVRNSARCMKCGIEVVSTHRHDFRRCQCGQTAVDGGSSYLRRLGSDFEDTSIIARK